MRADAALMQQSAALLTRLLEMTNPADSDETASAVSSAALSISHSEKENQLATGSTLGSKMSATDGGHAVAGGVATTARAVLAFEVHLLTAFFLSAVDADQSREIQNSAPFRRAVTSMCRVLELQVRSKRRVTACNGRRVSPARHASLEPRSGPRANRLRRRARHSVSRGTPCLQAHLVTHNVPTWHPLRRRTASSAPPRQS